MYQECRIRFCANAFGVQSASDTDLAAIVAHLMGHVPGGASRPGAPVKPAVDVRKNEREANYAAANYLRQAGIAPESLFDAMTKLKMSESHAVSSSNDSRTDFEAMQNHGDNGAADFGRMLDAGQVSSRAP